MKTLFWNFFLFFQLRFFVSPQNWILSLNHSADILILHADIGLYAKVDPGGKVAMKHFWIKKVMQNKHIKTSIPADILRLWASDRRQKTLIPEKPSNHPSGNPRKTFREPSGTRMFCKKWHFCCRYQNPKTEQ